MEKEISIQIISRFQGGDEIKRRLRARYSLRGHEIRLAYKQQLDPEQPALTPELLLINLDEAGNPRKVVMKRPGSRFHLTFILGEPCKSLYDTPAGAIEVELLTQQMAGSFHTDQIELDLRYELRLGGEPQGVTELMVRA